MRQTSHSTLLLSLRPLLLHPTQRKRLLGFQKDRVPNLALYELLQFRQRLVEHRDSRVNQICLVNQNREVVRF